MLFLRKFNNPAKNPGARTRTLYGPGSSGWRWTWTGGTIWVRLSSALALALAAAPQTRTYVCARPCGGWGDGGCHRDFWGAQTSKAGLSLSRLILKVEMGPGWGFWTNTMPPSPRRPLPIPPTATSLATPNMLGQTTSVQHLTRPSAKQYFLLTSGNDCIRGRSAYKSPRSDGMLSSSSVQSVSLSVPFSLPPNQEAHQGPKQQF